MRKRRSAAEPSTEDEYYSAGFKHGRDWRKSEGAEPSAERFQEAAHNYWYRYYCKKNARKGWEWQLLLQKGNGYISGFMKGSGMKSKLCPVPLRKTAAAIVCAGQEVKTLRRILRQLRALPLKEIIVVLHNASDELFSVASRSSNTIIAHLPEKIDSDVGRALGAKLSTADTLLFVDGECEVSAESLARFLWECDKRLDVALNDTSPGSGLFHQRNGAQHIHEFLNASLSRPDLKNNSLSTLPFALSRHAFKTIGAPKLAVPAKAHAAAILAGLNIGFGGSVMQQKHPDDRKMEKGWKTAAGDHAEALREALTVKGSRLSFADMLRNRTVLGGDSDDKNIDHHTDVQPASFASTVRDIDT